MGVRKRNGNQTLRSQCHTLESPTITADVIVDGFTFTNGHLAAGTNLVQVYATLPRAAEE